MYTQNIKYTHRHIKHRAFNPKKGYTPTWIKLTSVRPQMVDIGSEQGLSNFETADITGLFRGFQKSENAALGQKMPFVDGH